MRHWLFSWRGRGCVEDGALRESRYFYPLFSVKIELLDALSRVSKYCCWWEMAEGWLAFNHLNPG